MAVRATRTRHACPHRPRCARWMWRAPPTTRLAPTTRRAASAGCGAPPPPLVMPGLCAAIAPPPHWMPIPERARIAVVCPIAFDAIYGATFFSLARCLVRLGARVDIVTPWETHADISASFTATQRTGEPPNRSAVAAFMIDAPVD